MKNIRNERKNLKYYSTQDVNNRDIDAIIRVLRSDHLSKGPKVEEFEEKLGKICDNRNALTVNSATSALHLAYMLAGVNSESLLWTSPITFVATTNAALQLGASIDFVDINPNTLNICPLLLEEKLQKAALQNRLPDIVTVVHFAGNPCNMDRIHYLSQLFGFKVIEDASHALGATYKNIPIGGDDRSEAAVFSFHPVKMITTGEGGALIVSSKNSWKRASLLRSHGIDNTVTTRTDKKIGWYYEQTALGYNYRMTEMQAAMGIEQLFRLNDFVNKRNMLASVYKEALASLPVKFQSISENTVSSYHLFTIQLTEEEFKRDTLYAFLKDHGIASQVHYIPVYKHPFYQSLGFDKNYCPHADAYFKQCLSIPLHQKLEIEDLQFVAEHLERFFLNQATPKSASNSASL